MEYDSNSSKQLDVESLNKALTRLGDLLAEKDKQVELTCCGGVISLLYFGSRNITHDVDAIFPANPDDRKLLIQAIKQVSQEQGLASEGSELGDASLWLNDSVSFFGLETKSDVVIFKHPNLVLKAASWEELLAHKVHASRDDKDRQDAVLLLQEILQKNADKDKPKSKQEIYEDVKSHAPASPTISDQVWQTHFDKVWEKTMQELDQSRQSTKQELDHSQHSNKKALDKNQKNSQQEPDQSQNSNKQATNKNQQTSKQKSGLSISEKLARNKNKTRSSAKGKDNHSKNDKSR